MERKRRGSHLGGRNRKRRRLDSFGYPFDSEDSPPPSDSEGEEVSSDDEYDIPLRKSSSISWKCKYGKMKKHMLSQFSILLDNYVRGVVGDFEESLCDGEGGGMVIVEEDEENEEEEISKERREREERREEARRARRRRARKERRRQEKLVKKKTEKLKAKKKKEKAVKKGGGAGGGGGGGGGGAGGEQEYVLTSLAGEVVKFSDGNMKEMYINMGNQDKCVFCSSVFGPYKTPSNRRYGLKQHFRYCKELQSVKSMEAGQGGKVAPKEDEKKEKEKEAQKKETQKKEAQKEESESESESENESESESEGEDGDFDFYDETDDSELSETETPENQLRFYPQFIEEEDDNQSEDEWNQNYNSLVEYKETSGHFNCPRLIPWLTQQSKQYANATLYKHRIQKLESLGVSLSSIPRSFRKSSPRRDFDLVMQYTPNFLTHSAPDHTSLTSRRRATPTVS